MNVIGIIPAIKIEKENGGIYACLGDNIRIRDCDGRVFSGLFICMNLGKDAEEDDTIELGIDGESVEVQCSYITDIEKIG